MWGRLHSSIIQSILLWSVVMALPFADDHVSAQEETSAAPVVEKSARERDLRDQLQKILHELEELQQQPQSGTSAVPVQPAVVQESPESTLAELIPQYELSDVSIVSNRVQRRPEGISLVDRAVGNGVPTDQDDEGIDGISAGRRVASGEWSA